MITEASCTRPPSLALHQRHLVDDRHQPRARTVFVKDPAERKCMRQAFESEHTVIGWRRSFEAPRTIACLGCDPATGGRLGSHLTCSSTSPCVLCVTLGRRLRSPALLYTGQSRNGMRRRCSGHNEAEKRLVKGRLLRVPSL